MFAAGTVQAADPGQAGDRGQREERSRGVPAVHLVAAEDYRQRSAHSGRTAARPDLGDVAQRDDGRVDGIAGLELPARDRGISGSLVPGEREQLDEVAVDGAHHGHRLLRDDRTVEPARHRLDRHPGRRPVTEQGPVRSADEAVDAQGIYHPL